MKVMTNKYIATKTYIDGKPRESDFEIKSSTLILSAELGSNDVVLKNLYVSIDPFTINRMKSYYSTPEITAGLLEPITPGKVTMLKEKLGFDDAFNYKEEADLKQALKRYIAIRTRIDGKPRESDFEIKSSIHVLSAELGSNDIVLKNLYVSIDPFTINRMKSYYSTAEITSRLVEPITPGEIIDAYGVAKVVASANSQFRKDDLVVGVICWGEYSILKGVSEYSLRKLDPMGFPLSNHVGIFASSGLTAFAGFYEVCKPKKGEKVFVSAALGSIGHLVGQYAKLFGCYVVGSTGSNEKVTLLKERLGFDDAFNYKEETDLKQTLKRHFPNGIDIYFDNVGAGMLEAVVDNMNNYGRIAACGVISEYTDSKKRATPDMLQIVLKRITVRGFLTADFMYLYPDFLSATIDHLRRGTIQTLEDISNGVESIPAAFVGLFHGDNIGKKIVKLADE